MNRHGRWIQLCRALGATRNVDSSYRQIEGLYRTPIRAYHNLRHVEHCLNEYDAVSRLAVNPAAVEAAIWFHDAVYDSKAADNEEKSASIAVGMLASMGVRAKLWQVVRKLILHTKHTGVPSTSDGKIIVDVDLAILGSSSAVFGRYEKAIRKEYGWVEESIFWPKRAEFLQTFLNRRRIYATEFFCRKYEAKARGNLSRSIARIGRMAICCMALCLCLTTSGGLLADDRTISVYVALADNDNQGIVPVPKAIGNGDDPENNLYWGTADGLKGCFDKSKSWRLIEKAESPEAANILRTRTYRHTATNVVLCARAYKGRAIKQCIQDFEAAVQTNAADLVVFIGHNGLMDFDLPVLKGPNANGRKTDCIVLCCKSDAYFKTRLLAAGGRPVLLTTQLMYPGAFILHAVADQWIKGADLPTIRASAGAAYAKNQKLSPKAALGVFSDMKE